jgi:hypothetical protein
MKNSQQNLIQEARHLMFLISFAACTILLTGCPEFKSVNLPAKATTNSLISVDLEIAIDEVTSDGSFYLTMPEDFLIHFAYFPEISPGEIFYFQWEHEDVSCGEGGIYLTTHLENRITLDSGVHKLRLKLQTGTNPGTYEIGYHLGSPGWSYDHITHSIELVNYNLNVSESDQHFSAFPNPVSDYLTITHQFNNNFIAGLYSTTGQPLQTNQSSNGTLMINTNDLPDGNYLVKLQSDDQQMITKKIIVKHLRE